MRTINTYSKGAPFYNASAPKKVAAKLFILQETQSHFLQSSSGRSPVNCFSECGPERHRSIRIFREARFSGGIERRR